MNNADRLVKMLDSLATMEEIKSKPRKREYLLAGIAIALAFSLVGSFDYADALITDSIEKHARVYRAIRQTECQRAIENAEHFGKLLAHVLNGGGIEAPGTFVSCRAKHSPEGKV